MMGMHPPFSRIGCSRAAHARSLGLRYRVSDKLACCYRMNGKDLPLCPETNRTTAADSCAGLEQAEVFEKGHAGHAVLFVLIKACCFLEAERAHALEELAWGLAGRAGRRPLCVSSRGGDPDSVSWHEVLQDVVVCSAGGKVDGVEFHAACTDFLGGGSVRFCALERHGDFRQFLLSALVAPHPVGCLPFVLSRHEEGST